MNNSQSTYQSAPPILEPNFNRIVNYPESNEGFCQMIIEEDIEKVKNLNINDEVQKNQKSILKPRDYQKKIYEKAKNQNSIIYVEIGKGKTFISIMLMAHHLGINIEDPSTNKKILVKNKKIIFLYVIHL